MRKLVLALLLALCTALAAAGHETVVVNGQEVACVICHESAEPTTEDWTLREGTVVTAPAAPAHETSEAPDVFIIDELSEIYVPVVFPHKLHAAMTEMTGGCVVCHHNQEDGEIHQCKACHGGPSNPENLEQPGLKGAYHRQCLSCHREWTHETDCVVCHAKIDPDKPFVPPAPSADIMGLVHPNVEEPDVHLYNSEEMEDTPFVTFHHRDHVHRYDLKCVQCHQEENCSRCHDIKVDQPHIKEDPHEDCMRCHAEEIESDCLYCHDEVQRGPFDHEARTGHNVTLYHPEQTCRDCHGGEERLEKIEDGCGNCHASDYQPEDFDHAITGSPLDELHVFLDCIDCHTGGFGSPAACDACHDDGRTNFDDVPAEDSEEAGDGEADAEGEGSAES